MNLKILVATGFGINCEEETAAAWRKAGETAHIVHLNSVFSESVSLRDFDVLCLPGGFSFGDDLGSGKVLANKLRFKRKSDGTLFFDDLKKFLEAGGFILGICNGFQALVKSGLLPNIAGNYVQEVTLTSNDSGKFEDRWVRMAPNRRRPPEFFNDLPLMELPVRHGEGKLLIGDSTVRDVIVKRGLDILHYADENGRPTGTYPQNPNGSDLHAAGLLDQTGKVFGLMPHPEAFLHGSLHPNWGRQKRDLPADFAEGQGLLFFRALTATIQQTRRSRP